MQRGACDSSNICYEFKIQALKSHRAIIYITLRHRAIIQKKYQLPFAVIYDIYKAIHTWHLVNTPIREANFFKTRRCLISLFKFQLYVRKYILNEYKSLSTYS